MTNEYSTVSGDCIVKLPENVHINVNVPAETSDWKTNLGIIAGVAVVVVTAVLIVIFKRL